MDAIMFTAKFKSLLEKIRARSPEDQQRKMLKLFESAIDYLPSVMEAAAKDNEILQWARQDFMQDFWNDYFEYQLIPMFSEKNGALRSQPGIKNFDVIMGFYFYSMWRKSLSNQSSTEEKLELLRRGVSFHSIHATKELLQYCMDADPVEHFYEIQKLLEETKLHGAPGYLLSADCYKKAYQKTKSDDFKIKSILCYYTACELECDSVNMIHNSFFGTKPNGYTDEAGTLLQSVDALCQSFGIDDFTKLRIKREARQEAQIFRQQYMQLPAFLPKATNP